MRDDWGNDKGAHVTNRSIGFNSQRADAANLRTRLECDLIRRCSHPNSRREMSAALCDAMWEAQCVGKSMQGHDRPQQRPRFEPMK